MVNHPSRGRRILLGATVFQVPAPEDIPALVARIARLWAELHEADRELALTVARSLPSMEIKRWCRLYRQAEAKPLPKIRLKALMKSVGAVGCDIRHDIDGYFIRFILPGGRVHEMKTAECELIRD